MNRQNDQSDTPVLDESEYLALYRRMKLIRSFEDKAAEIYRLGKVAHALQIFAGEEAVGVGAIHALAQEDYVVSTYRKYGHRLASGSEPRTVMAELLGVGEKIASGDGSSTPTTESRTHFIDGNTNEACGLSIAAGLALAIQYKNEPVAVCCLFGDETLAQGAFHEALNVASIMNLPIVFVCENNFYGMGTFIDNSVCQEELYRLAESYKIEGVRVDGMDVLNVYAATMKAATRAREGDGPSLIEAVTYRFRSATFSDPDEYETRREEPIWRERDPILNLRGRLVGEIALAESKLDQIDQEVVATIDDAVKFAETSLARSIDAAARASRAGED